MLYFQFENLFSSKNNSNNKKLRKYVIHITQFVVP